MKDFVMTAQAIESYRDLRVWQRAMDLAEEVYRLAQRLPRQEQYGLIAQMHRAAASVPANIAEGYGRHHTADFLRFLWMANGSLLELETHLYLVERLAFLKKEELAVSFQLAAETGKMLQGLIRSLKAKSSP